MSALVRQLALVSESKAIPRGDVMKVSAALQKQVTRDLEPIWEISATVDAFDKLEDVPVLAAPDLGRHWSSRSGRDSRRRERPAVRADHRIVGP
jgi:hypothetical protein